jgi:hypothetical protein
MRNVSKKTCRENQNTHFVFSNFCPKNRTVYEIRWKYFEEPVRPQMTVRRSRFACSITKATDTLRICNTYCFFTAKIVIGWRLNFTLYEHCRPCLSSNVAFLLLKFVSIITEIRRLTVCFTTMFPYLHHISFFFVSVTNFVIKL